MATAFVLTTNRTVHLYYGDEIAMVGVGDRVFGRASTELDGKRAGSQLALAGARNRLNLEFSWTVA